MKTILTVAIIIFITSGCASQAAKNHNNEVDIKWLRLAIQRYQLSQIPTTHIDQDVINQEVLELIERVEAKRNEH